MARGAVPHDDDTALIRDSLRGPLGESAWRAANRA